MAKQLNVDMRFKADTSQAKKAIDDLNASLSKLAYGSVPQNSAINPATFEAAAKSARELTYHLNQAFNTRTGNLDLSKLDASLKASKTSLGELTKNFAGAGEAGQQAFVALAQSIAAADQPVLGINSHLATLWTTLKNVARFQLSSSIIHGLMGGLQSAYGYAQNLNQSLNNIRIVTGDSTEKMAQFAREANQAAKALSSTTLDYTNASLIYYQQGLNDQAVKARTDVTVKLANVTRQSAEEVSNQMTAIWNNFDDGSKSMEYFADVITALGATTASSSAEIATGLERFAPIAGTIGLSYEKATAALATIVATTRQSAETVGTGLRTIFSRFESLKLGETLEDGVDLNKYTKTLQTIGVNVLDANGKLREMDDILDDIGAHWQQLDNTQRTAFATTVGGVRQYTNLIALFDNWDAMQRNLLTVQGAEGALQKQADTYAESWEAASKQIRTSLQGLWDTLLNDKAFIKLSNRIADIISGVDRFVQSFGGVKTIVIGALSIIASMVANKIGPAFENIKNNIKILRGGASEVYREMQTKATTSINAEINRKDTNGEFVYSETQRAQLSGASKLLQVKTQLSAVENKLSATEKLRANVTVQGIELQIKKIEEETNEYEKQTKVVEKLSDQIKEKQQVLVKLNTEQTNAQKELTLAQNNFRSSITGSQYQVIARPKLGTELGLNDTEFNDLQQKITAVGQKIETQIFDTLIAGNQKATTIGGQLQSLFQSVATRNLFTVPQNADLNQVEQYRQRIVEVGTSFQELFKDNQTAVAAFKALGTSLRGASDPVALYNTRLQAFIDSLKGTTIHSQKAVEVLKKMKSADPSAIQKYEDAVTRLQKAEQALNTTGPKTQEQIDKLQKEYNEAKQEADKLRASIDGLNGVLDKTVQGIDFSHKVTGSEALMTAAGAAGSLLMSLNMLNSVIDAFSAEDPFQGIVQGLSSLLFTLPMAINAWKSLATVTAWAEQTQTAFKLATIASNAALTTEEKLKQALIALKTKDADIDKIVIALKGKQVTVEELVKLGIKEENAERIVNTITTTANTVATEANTLAKMKNVTATFLQSKVAKILLIGILTAIAAYKTYQKIQENIRQKHLDSANAAKEEAEVTKQDADSYNELADAWEKAHKANKDEKSEENRQALKEATDDLIKSYGEELGYLAAAQENYDLLAEKIRQVREEKAALAAENAAAALTTAEIAFSDQSRKNAKGSTSWGTGSDFRTWFGNGTIYGQRNFGKRDETIIEQAIQQLQAEGKLSNIDIDWQTGDLGLFGTAEQVYEAAQLIAQAARNIDSTKATQSEIYTNLVRFTNENKEMYELYEEAKQRMGETTLASALFNIKETDITNLEDYNKKIKELAGLLGKEFTVEDANNLASFMLGQKFSTFANQKEFYDQLSETGKASFNQLSEDAKKIAITIPVALFEEANNQKKLNDIIQYYQVLAKNNKIQLQIEIAQQGQNMAIAGKTSIFDWQTWANSNIDFSDQDQALFFNNKKVENVEQFLLLTDAQKEQVFEEWEQTGQEAAARAIMGLQKGQAITVSILNETISTKNNELSNAETAFNNTEITGKGNITGQGNDDVTITIGLYKELIRLQTLYNNTAQDDFETRTALAGQFNELAGWGKLGLSISSDLSSFTEAYNSPEIIQAALNLSNLNNEINILKISLNSLENGGEVDQEWLTNFAKKVEALGFNFDEISEYVQLLADSSGEDGLRRFSKATYELALAQFKSEKAFENGAKAAKEFYEAISKGDKSSTTYSKNLALLSKSLEDIFDINIFDEEWLNENQGKVEALFNGTKEEAFAAWQYISKLGLAKFIEDTGEFEVNGQSVTGAKTSGYDAANGRLKTELEIETVTYDQNDLNNAITGLIDSIDPDQLALNPTVNAINGTEEFIGALANLASASEETQGKITAALNASGFDVEYVTQDISAEDWASAQKSGSIQVGDETVPITAVGYTGTSAGGTVTYPIVTARAEGIGGTTPPKGGGGGSKAKKHDRKQRDAGDRYKPILAKQDDKKRQIDAAKDRADRLAGKARIDNLREENKLLGDNIELQKEYINEITNYLAQDKNDMANALAGFGLTIDFDPNGVINNYDAIMDKLYAIYNQKADQAMDEDAWKRFEDSWQNAIDAVNQYIETRDLEEEQQENLNDMLNEQFDQLLEIVNTELELNIQVNDQDLNLLDHLLNKVNDDAYKAAEAIALMGDKAAKELERANYYQNAINNTLATYGLDSVDQLLNMSPEELQGLGITQDTIDNLIDWNNELLDITETLDDLQKEIREKVIDTFDELNEKVQDSYDFFSHYNTLLESYRNIADLNTAAIGKESRELIRMLDNSMLRNSQNALRSSKQIYDKLVEDRQIAQQKLQEAEEQGLIGEADAYRDLIEDIDGQIRDAQEQWLADWEDGLQKAKDILERSVDDAAKEYEELLAPLYGTLDGLNEVYEMRKEVDADYVQDYEKLYQLSKLNRDLTKTLNEVDGIQNRKQLLALQEKINKLQKDGTKMSEYDLQVLEKEFEVQQARIALEEAANAKSTVRLQRDNEGNWGYVYAADADTIEEAQQSYEDKLYEYQKLNDEYIRKMQDQLMDLTRTAEEKIREVWADTSLTEEEKHAKEEEIRRWFNLQRDFIEEQMTHALTNQENLTDRFNQTYQNAYANVLDTYDETILAQVTQINDLNTQLDAITTAFDNFANKAQISWQAYVDSIEETNEIAGTATGDLVTTITDAMTAINDASDDNVENINEYATAVQDGLISALDSAINQELQLSKQIADTTTQIEAQYQAWDNVLRVLNNVGNAAHAAYYPLDTLARSTEQYGISQPSYNPDDWNANEQINEIFSHVYDSNYWDVQHNIVDELIDAIDEWVSILQMNANAAMNAFGDIGSPYYNNDTTQQLQQNVVIEANFPGVTDRSQIEEAFENLVNKAAQFANRKRQG